MSRSISAGSAAPPAPGIKLAAGAPRWLYFAIFAISGFSGLIYESIWSHYLKLFLGHAAYAQSLVLMIFMGGLAAGSWLAARYSERWRAPILFYAIVEGVIGVIALVFHDAFVSVSDAFYFSILPGMESPAFGNALKWTAAAALIVPQSVLLGMTFPLMSTGILRRFPDQPGASLAMLYFTNSIGAAIGVLASGFWLLGLFGLPGTIMTAGLLNIALALTVWILVKVDPKPIAAPIVPDERSVGAGHDGLAALFFFSAAVTGASSFMYEIGWIRMLSLVLGSTTHSFELMLSAFITGLALGGLWIKRRIDHLGDPVRFSGWVQVLMGVLAIATLPLYVQTFDWMAALLSGLQQTGVGYTLFTLLSHGLALLVMVPTTFLAGMTLPLFTHILMRGQRGERAIGRVYAANTVGAIAGVLFAVHIGLPMLGLKSLIGLAAALDVVLGLILLYRGAERRDVRPLIPAALLGAAALAAVMLTVNLDPRRLASGVYRSSAPELRAESNVVFYKDGKTATISLSVTQSTIAIATNGKPDASIEMKPEMPRTIDEITMVMAAALPLGYKPDARRVANIGLGSGLTTHTFLAHDALETVDTIEIESAMVLAAQGFGERVARAFEDPRSHIHVEDAKTFFSLQNRDYDIIVAEPSNPWVSGVASLFSDEFYRSVKNYLTEDGVLVQWLQLYEFNDDLVLSVLKALANNFSDYVIYNTDNTDILIVAKANGALGEPDFTRVLTGTLKEEAGDVGLASAADFAIRRTGSRPIIESLIAYSPVPTNSDYFPFLDLNAGKARFVRQVAAFFRSWSVSTLPLLEMLAVSEPIDTSAVVSDDSFQRSTSIRLARALHAGLTSDSREVRNNTLVSALPSLAALELLADDSCELADREDLWLKGLITLAQNSLPFLEPRLGTELLDSVTGACRQMGSERVRAWTNLYYALAQRNARQMVTSAHEVFAHDPLGDPRARLYVVLTGMLGEVASGRADNAVRLWEEHRDQLVEVAGDPDLQLLLNVAMHSARVRTEDLISRQ